jgi:outer membrane receptor protein involved in Fe transport
MKDSPVPRSRDRLLTALLALGLAAAPVAFAAEPTAPTAPAASENTASPASATKPSSDEQTVVLNPFEVTTDKDNGYRATNSISGSRVNTSIKDIPIPIQVITSQFINDIGATDLRSALAYTSSIMLQTQNDLSNKGGTFGSPYGPGGVNNPQGVTSNINQVQLKIRGFITNNTLRDGFLRGNGSDSVNIDRIEVVSGPNALLYGTGNFGGVVDYLTKQPLDKQQGAFTASYGSYNFMRAALDVTGPISETNHLDYRLGGSWESSETSIDSQKNSHFFIAPTVSWKPTPTTSLLIDTEYGKSKQNGYGFQALRAAQGNSATPINNDQLEAVSFYWPPGANPRTFNLSGPDTYNDQQESNIELKLTQQILKETEILPEVTALIGYNRSSWATQTQDVNGQITGPILPGNPGYNLRQTIITLGAENGIDGEIPSNGNLVFGPLPDSVVKYAWNQNHAKTTREQERVELTARKTLFERKWYAIDEQVLVGYSALYNDRSTTNWQTIPGSFSYKSPNELTPIRFGKQGDGAPDPALFNNNRDNVNKGWDSAYYVNNYIKLFNSRLILMNGIRRDKIDNWSTNTNIAWDAVAGAPGAATTTTNRAAQVLAYSRQNGAMIQITKNFSIYGLKASGLQPNFGGLHNAETGDPVGSDTARSEEFGIKFDLLEGRISGTISHYKITKTAWESSGFSTPAPLGNPKFDPNKPIVYNLRSGFNGLLAPDSRLPGVTPTGQTGQIQSDPTVVAAWNAAVDAGAVYKIAGSPDPTIDLYLNASDPAGAAYLDAAFASVNAHNGDWPGWLYGGNDINDPNINNATLDDAAFQNGPLNPAWQVIDQSKGWDGQLLITPTDNLQIVINGSVGAKVTRLNLGKWLKYPYPQDRWATWYFPNGGFGLKGQPLNIAYTDPTDTSTRTNTGVSPGDDTPEYAFSLFANYKFDGRFKGLTVGAGGTWHSKEEFFSGVTHGSGQVQTNVAGEPIIVYSPPQYLVNIFAKYEWNRWGHSQFVQLNVDNVLNDRKIYGLIYSQPLTAKLTYGIGF